MQWWPRSSPGTICACCSRCSGTRVMGRQAERFVSTRRRIGRRLKMLEAGLGARLFTRTPSGLVATEAGTSLVVRAMRIEAEVLAAELELRGARPSSCRHGARHSRRRGRALRTRACTCSAAPQVPRPPRGASRRFAGARSIASGSGCRPTSARRRSPRRDDEVRGGALGLLASRAYLERERSTSPLTATREHDFIGLRVDEDADPRCDGSGSWSAIRAGSSARRRRPGRH